ncbi:Chemotaxis protein methyltransferase Cher2 [Anatilimnocola aggregata]|uniref:protein-glutamate O-methyltransferase n=1 Tax=Anatilimnocola aggregata TaxID=2528021 RepID=A0A517YFB0_9BACT|nr:protein-glutamate O-methyltransferase CheR [Anatilimnocola aggregata]QDU28917.1 Chemotaxis protein methyltransferase Cher2 [Anatilimnocola aggregata]
MWPATFPIDLPPTVFKILRDLIHDHAGIHFDDAKRGILAEKLSPRVVECGLTTFLDYYYLLKYGPGSEQEWPAVTDALSVPETYFWREIDQIQAFVEQLLPAYVKMFPGRTIRIWCGACCTGEEPLTIAMALNETGWFQRASFEIFASDASPAAIAKARQGIYRDRSFRALSPELKEKYFLATAGGWQINPELHSGVHWSVANLIKSAEIAPFVESPFIFCRNVFIYFSTEMIARTVDQFASQMARPGYLFIGAAESLLKVTDEFDLQQVGDAFVYTLN